MNPDQSTPETQATPQDPGAEKLSRKGLIWFFVFQCLALVIVALSMLDAGEYGWTLFGVIPFSLGLTAGAFSKLYKSKKLLKALWLIVAVVGGVSILLIAVGGEGFICILMALGIVAGPAMVGATLGYFIRNVHRIYIVALIITLNSSFITYDYLDESQVISVATETITINASQKAIWNVLTHGVVFNPNTNMFFEAGVNYPTSMELQYGEDRKCYLMCKLSSGSAALEVERLDTLRSIRFKVPDVKPMEELSIYDSLDAAHLRGYFNPVFGEFSIEMLSESQCILTARTSYTYKITPVFYWKWWSDYLVNTMHRHVLNDVKSLAERKPL